MGERAVAITVACCLWGDWPVESWGEEYVYRLYRGVTRNLPVEHEFVCFADDPERLEEAPFEVRPLNPPIWKGCLPKLYVYSPEAGLSDRVLLFDLDNIITGDLSDIASYDGEFCVRAWFRGWDAGYRNKLKNPEIIDGDMISFIPGYKSLFLWNAFLEDPEKVAELTEGHERWFMRSMIIPDLWQEIVGNQIVSFKNHCAKGLPEDARVVSCHGNPRPHRLNIDWVKEHWT